MPPGGDAVSFTPLWRWCWRVSGLPMWDASVTDVESFTTRTCAMMLGVTTRTVERFKASDRVPALAADRAAVALGVHPAEVWGSEWGNPMMKGAG